MLLLVLFGYKASSMTDRVNLLISQLSIRLTVLYICQRQSSQSAICLQDHNVTTQSYPAVCVQ